MYRMWRVALAFSLLTIAVQPSLWASTTSVIASPLRSQCLFCPYNGGGEYLYVEGTIDTLSMNQQIYASLPSPSVQTVCEKVHMSYLQRWLPELTLLMKVGCYAYKAYAWIQWLQVRWAIHQAALNHGCAIYLLSAATSLRGDRVHLASTFFGRSVEYLPYGVATYVAAKVDRYMPYNHHVVTCTWGIPRYR